MFIIDQGLLLFFFLSTHGVAPDKETRQVQQQKHRQPQPADTWLGSDAETWEILSAGSYGSQVAN